MISEVLDGVASQPAASLRRAIDILTTVSERRGHPVRIVDIAVTLGIPKSSAHRLVQTLVRHGFLSTCSHKGAVVIGTVLVDIVMRTLQMPDLHVLIEPTFTRVANSVGATAFLAHLTNGRVEVIDTFPPTRQEIGYFNPGKGPRPTHACSSSKAILGFHHPDFVRTLISGALIRYTNNTILDADTYMKELLTVKEQGFAECHEEIESGVYSIAVPVLNDINPPEFSVGLAGPAASMRLHQLDDIKRKLGNVGKQLATWLDLGAFNSKLPADYE